jgi:hypothetical protein
MSAVIHPESGLTKSAWSDADFDAMGWHDVTVHGLAVQPGTSRERPQPRLLLDLDYVVRWVQPVAPEQHFTFWIAPATLVFEDVWDIEGDLDFRGVALQFDIDHIHRSTPGSPEGGPLHRHDPQWRIEGHYFELTFRASGFRQYLRQPPRHSPGLALSHSDRGALSFAEQAFA